MQGAPSGIGYGLKYQVKALPNALTLTFFRLLLRVWTGIWDRISMSRLGASLMSELTRITPASSPELSVSKKKTRWIVLEFRIRFMLGLVESGLGVVFQVHLIRLSSGGTELICEGLFSHPSEIWDLRSCPFDQRIFSTVFSSGKWFNYNLHLELAGYACPSISFGMYCNAIHMLEDRDVHFSHVNCELHLPTAWIAVSFAFRLHE